MSAHLSGIWPPRAKPAAPENDPTDNVAFTFKPWGEDEILEAAFWLTEDEPMPARLALPLKRALMRVLDGDLDIARNLGLRPEVGRACDMPGTKEMLIDRDSLICRAVASAPGDTFTAKVRHVFAVCKAMQAERQVPARATAEEAALFACVLVRDKDPKSLLDEPGRFAFPMSLDRLKDIARGRSSHAPEELWLKA